MSWFTNHPTVILGKVEKKLNFLNYFFSFYPPTVNIICFEEKIKIYFSGSVCVFLKVTLLKKIVLSRFLAKCELFKDLIQTVGLPD